MLADRVTEAAGAFLSVVDAVSAPSSSESEMIGVLRECGSARDRLDTVVVGLIAGMMRRGVFSAHGYTCPEYAIADLLGCDRSTARRRVRLVEQVCPRIGLDGHELPAVLPATGMALAAGQVGVRHAEVIAAVLTGPAARRLASEVWSGAEAHIAEYAASTGAAPNDVAGWAKQLVEGLDQDGEEPPVEPEQRNELHLTRNPSGTGGRVRGELDGPTFEAVHAAVGALSRPLPDVDRTLADRQAGALGEICDHALRHHGDLPDGGGERPQVRVTVDFERLRAAVGGAHLDTGAWYSPSQLRLLACDCGIVPVVLGSAGEPLDIGRASRVVPSGIRRAVAIRDRGCAYPGCDRPPAHCDIHHCHEWIDGGATSLDNCVMLCRAHHRIVHGTEWTVRIQDGRPEFRPPEFLHKQPRRMPTLL